MEYNDQKHLLKSNPSKAQQLDHGDGEDELVDNNDFEAAQGGINRSGSSRGGHKSAIKDLIRGLSGRRPSSFHNNHHHNHTVLDDDILEDGATPEWALLLIGFLLGLASGLCVTAFNKGICRDVKALQEKAVRKAAQAATGGKKNPKL